MLRSVNWGEKLGQFFGSHGHLGRVLKVTALFACAVILLIGLYRVRTTRITNEETTKNQLKSVVGGIGSGGSVGSGSGDRWLVLGNPDDESTLEEANPSSTPGSDYLCAAVGVAGSAGWKIIIIGPPLTCCSKPECHSMEKNQFLRLPYRSASVLRHLMGHGGRKEPYKETLRNLAFLWAIHRGAKFVFDAYVEEYQSAEVLLSVFEEELSRQLRSLALDDSLSLVEERGRRSSHKANPYSHFGRSDVKLLPSGASPTLHISTSGSNSSKQSHHFPSFRICEVRPPSIEKFLEIDEGWWDMSAPSLVLPGDTMPPLCTRNTLFSPEVFWALPILPDYSTLDEDGLSGNGNLSLSRIPPWYIRGLWSQSLLGDLGGSIRLSLSKVPTLQITRDYSSGMERETESKHSTSLGPSNQNHQRTKGSRLLKRWNCRSKSTFRCLLLMAKELSKSVYLGKDDISLIEAWVVDLKSIHYTEPRMLPKRRTQTNPCLGADGLHGVSFHPALEPKQFLSSTEFVTKRNKTLEEIRRQSPPHLHSHWTEVGVTHEGGGQREKRETERPVSLSQTLLPPSESISFLPDWSLHTSSDYGKEGGDGLLIPPVYDGHYGGSSLEEAEDSYLPIPHPTRINPHHKKEEDEEEEGSYEVVGGDRGIPFPTLDKTSPTRRHSSSFNTRTGKQFRAFLQQVVAKSVKEGAVADEFPILKAMAENICPGFGPLLPYQPTNVHSDILLIIAFTNHHYDLIPSLEVIYRSTYPNILYCGHPHESVEIFHRKYQTVEHRSFSFLPTYTRASYECLLGAIEMNYDVKGFLLITDETLLAPLPQDIGEGDKEKLWVSSTGHDKVTRNNWQGIDPGGQKLPKLLDGITATWKLFSYILQGQDSVPFIQPETKRMGRRRRRSTKEGGETLQGDETAYIHSSRFQLDNKSKEGGEIKEKVTIQNETGREMGSGETRDLEVSDWDYLNPTKIINRSFPFLNESEGVGDENEEVLIGEEEDENSPPDTNMSDILVGLRLFEGGNSSPGPIPLDDFEEGGSENEKGMEEHKQKYLDGPPRVNSSKIMMMEEMDESGGFPSSTPGGVGGIGSDETEADTSLGVPLYHVEHLEPPIQPKWRPPSDEFPSTTDQGEVGMSRSTEGQSTTEGSSGSSTTEIPVDQQRSTEVSPSGPTSTTLDTNHYHVHEDELKREMESLLEGVHETYASLLGIVTEYEENNKDNPDPPKLIHPSDFSSELPEPSLLDDVKSHRISPREFRHIRCTRVDDGHQSELCGTLRNYVKTLGGNLGRDVRLFHSSTPVYYVPSGATRSVYSIANVLLHYGVMDELALPLLFRGIAKESEWIHLNRTTELSHLQSHHFLFPFNLHKVYGDKRVQDTFCHKFLLPILSQ